MGRTKIIDLLDKLEVAIDSGRRIPLLNKVIVDGYSLLEIIDQIRIALPDEIKQAERLLAEKEEIVLKARQEAERMLGSARDQVAGIVSESDITRAAREEAHRIIEGAKQVAREIRAGAEEYADETLKTLEESLQRTLKVIHKGREELRRKQAGSGATRISAS